MRSGVERLETVEFFAHAGEVDRLSGYVLGRQRGAAASVAVELAQHQAGNPHPLVEGAGHRQRLLAGHGVDHQDLFARLKPVGQRCQLIHQGFVDLQAPGGIDDHQVAEILSQERLEAFLGAFGGFVVLDLEHRDADLLAEHSELLARRGSLGVRRHQQRPAALGLVLIGEFAGAGGLAGTLEAHEQPHVVVAAQGGVLRRAP